MPNAVTWGYATLRWTHHVNKSGTPRQTLLQALITFDLCRCYLDTLTPVQTIPGCLETIERVAFPSRQATVISKLEQNM